MWDIVGLAEVRWPGFGETAAGKGYKLWFSREEAKHEHGIIFLVQKKVVRKVAPCTFISDRQISFHIFSARPHNVTIFQVYTLWQQLWPCWAGSGMVCTVPPIPPSCCTVTRCFCSLILKYQSKQSRPSAILQGTQDQQFCMKHGRTLVGHKEILLATMKGWKLVLFGYVARHDRYC